jgi:Polyketide cyclase / dehydrase and lipid transport
MKILVMAVAVLVGLVLGVVIIGWLLPRRHVVTRSATYRATPETLYGLIGGSQKWRPDVVSAEDVPDNSGRELVRETTQNGEAIVYQILDRRAPFSLNRRIATSNLPYSGNWVFSIEPAGESTVVHITEDGEVYNPIFRFVSRFIFGQTRTVDAYLRALGQATGQQVEIH